MSLRKLGTRKNFGVYLIAFCLLIWLLAVATPVSADPSASPASVDTLEQMRQSIDQQRSQLKKERDRLSKIEQAVQSQLTGIQQNIQATDNAYQDYAAQIELANKRLRAVQEDLAIAESRYYQKQAAIIARLRFLQRRRRTGFGWDILLKSQNLNEFLDRRRHVKLLYQADRKILVSFKTEANRINQQKIQVETQKNQIALLTQQLLAQKAQYQAQLGHANLQKADLSSTKLIGVDLRNAQLQKAKLRNSNLSNADLRGANLAGADLQGTTFVTTPPVRSNQFLAKPAIATSFARIKGVNFAQVKNLEAEQIKFICNNGGRHPQCANDK